MKRLIEANDQIRGGTARSDLKVAFYFLDELIGFCFVVVPVETIEKEMMGVFFKFT